MAIKELMDIQVYQEALQLAREVYLLVKEQNLQKEYSLQDQIKRAALSVAANIAEGYGRKIRKDFSQFLSISLGSVNEVICYLDFISLSFQLKTTDLRSKYQTLAKRIHSFRQYLLTTDN